MRERDQHLRDPERIGGRPRHRDVLPALPPIPAERLDRGLPSREPPRVGLGGAGLRVAVGDLLWCEHALAHRRVPPERPLHPGDLAQVDPEPQDLHAPRVARPAPRGLYSTVTLFARLRGWSTSQPRSLATWYASI